MKGRQRGERNFNFRSSCNDQPCALTWTGRPDASGDDTSHLMAKNRLTSLPWRSWRTAESRRRRGGSEQVVHGVPANQTEQNSLLSVVVTHVKVSPGNLFQSGTRYIVFPGDKPWDNTGTPCVTLCVCGCVWLSTNHSACSAQCAARITCPGQVLRWN